MKIRKAVLLLACAVSWGIAVWFAGRLWAAYPLVSVRSDVPVTGRQLEALRSALRQEDGASALEPGRGIGGKPLGNLRDHCHSILRRV